MLSSNYLTVLLCVSAAATTIIFHLWFSQTECSDDWTGYLYRANRGAAGESDPDKLPRDQTLQEDVINYSRCSPLAPLRIFVHSFSHPLAETLSNHPAATKDEKEACLFIAFTTGADYSSKPSSWSSLGEPGLNHVVINLNKDVSIAPEGREMIVQSSFENGGFRSHLDFSLSPDVLAFDREAWTVRPAIMPLKREVAFSLVVDSPSNSNESRIPEVPCVGDCFPSLVSSSFCLLPPSRTFHTRLLSALRARCIPIILSTTQPLPFQDQIDWKTASFRIPPSMVDYVSEMLQQIAKEDVLELRRRGKVFLDRIDDVQALSKSLVAALSERIHVSLEVYPEVPGNLIYPSDESTNGTIVKKRSTDSMNETIYAERIRSRTGVQKFTTNNLYSRARWNSGRDLTYTPNTVFDVPQMPGDAAMFEGTREGLTAAPGKKGLGLLRDQEQFTGTLTSAIFANLTSFIMILTYNRDSGVKKIIEKLRGCLYLNKIIIVWNNLERRPNGTWPEIHVPVEFVLAERNTLLSRFLPYDRIETEAVVSMDDDTGLGQPEMEFAFRMWRENRDRIVGYPDRFHRVKNGKLAYGLGAPCTYSLVLTGFAMMHKEFLYEFSYNQHPSILEHIDNHRNCEDIAMNFLVAHLTRRPPLKVVKKLSMSNGSKAGLSARGGHYVKRDECMHMFTSIYGYNPLLFSQEVAVPKNMGRCVSGL